MSVSIRLAFIIDHLSPDVVHLGPAKMDEGTHRLNQFLDLTDIAEKNVR